MRRRLELVERGIRNCTEAMASMGLSPSLRTQLTDLETEHRELSEKLTTSEPRGKIAAEGYEAIRGSRD